MSLNAYTLFFNHSSPDEALPLLRYVQKKGDTTVYEWRTGQVPQTVERPEVKEIEDLQHVEEGEVSGCMFGL